MVGEAKKRALKERRRNARAEISYVSFDAQKMEFFVLRWLWN